MDDPITLFPSKYGDLNVYHYWGWLALRTSIFFSSPNGGWHQF